VARDTESIERDIERARDQLANTLDELATRANPRKVVEQAKSTVLAKVEEPQVRLALVGVGALFVAAVLYRIFR
jgi:hypothetical protein